MKLDILAFAAHPDDVELSCSGTILKHMAQGKKTGVIDITSGELGTRGNSELRLKEAEKATQILQLSARENLGFADGFFINDKMHQMEIIKRIRYYKPEIVLCNAIQDRHPDHGRAAKLVSEACFFSGLIKMETEFNGGRQDVWRPKAVYHYIQDRYIKPDFVVDISGFFEKKQEAILAFSSQFYNSESDEPDTPISGPEFMDFIKARASDFGRPIGVKYAEGFTVERYIGVNNLFDLN